MESRLLLAADLAPAIEQPAGEFLLPDGELYLPGSIAGRVFATSSPIGVYRPGDQGIVGVRIELLDASGARVAETVTDDAGRYDFPALAPGVYAVREFQPAGYADGPDWLGTAGGRNESDDLISEIALLPGVDASGYDFAERFILSEEELPPGESAEPSIPPATPLPIDEPQSEPLAGFVPLPTVEWRRAEEAVERHAEAAPVDAFLPETAPLRQRRSEPLFGSGGQPIKKESEIDFDAALEQAYDTLAGFFEAIGATGRSTRYREAGETAATSAHSEDAATHDAAYEQAMTGQQPVAKPTTPPANETPERAAAPLHHLAGKPAT